MVRQGQLRKRKQSRDGAKNLSEKSSFSALSKSLPEEFHGTSRSAATARASSSNSGGREVVAIDSSDDSGDSESDSDDIEMTAGALSGRGTGNRYWRVPKQEIKARTQAVRARAARESKLSAHGVSTESGSESGSDSDSGLGVAVGSSKGPRDASSVPSDGRHQGGVRAGGEGKGKGKGKGKLTTRRNAAISSATQMKTKSNTQVGG